MILSMNKPSQSRASVEHSIEPLPAIVIDVIPHLEPLDLSQHLGAGVEGLGQLWQGRLLAAAAEAVMVGIEGVPVVRDVILFYQIKIMSSLTL